MNSITDKTATFALTTTDNPFNPFTQFDKWFGYDMEKGYNSCGYLGRIAKLSDALSDQETSEEIERAIDEIIQYDYLNIYMKVRSGDKLPPMVPLQL